MPRGKPLNTMNPFSNNRPRLTASERIRNKRDAAIYQGEKQRFQRGKSKCRNRNVKFYRNGKVRSVVNYKMQNSLARGDILCNDCDDKGNLCAAPSKKDDLASVYMGNNNYSEFWGGQSVGVDGGRWRQVPGSVLINSDISGVWGGSLTDVAKADLSNAILPGSNPPIINPIPIPFGYVNNLIKIPINLNGTGVMIDPSNILFPNELCKSFKHTNKLSYLKTYLVLTTCLTKPGPCDPVSGVCTFLGIECNDPLLNSLIGSVVSIGMDIEYVANGIVSSICCVGSTDRIFGTGETKGNFGIFNIYIELSFAVWMKLGTAINFHNNKAFTPWSIEPEPFFSGGFEVVSVINPGTTSTSVVIFWWMIQSVNIIQGSIPPSMNQTKYNATKQSYMSCLENSTRKIKFTKQNTRIPVKNVFCTPIPACVPEITFTIQKIDGSPDIPPFQDLNDGKYLLFNIGSNTNTTWNFNIKDILNSCTSRSIVGVVDLTIDYLVVGGGGSGGYSVGGGEVGTTGGGGGGGVQQGTITISGGTTSNFQVKVGAGSPGTGFDASDLYANRFTTDASPSSLEVNSMLIAADPGQNGASATYPVSVTGSADYLGATGGGNSGGTGTGGIIINPSTDDAVDGSGNPDVRGSAGGGGSLQDGSNNGVFGDISTWYVDSGGVEIEYFTSGGNGGDGVSSSITGSTFSYGGGGGGACFPNASAPASTTILPGLGANGGPGGNGANARIAVGNAATQYGGGGGGSVYVDVSKNGGAGYRGVVILKFYKSPA